MIVRRERPHPGAQLSFTDHDGYRFQAILTDQPDPDIAVLERRHRQRARVEDRIRDDKDTGLAKLPFKAVRAQRGVAGDRDARARPDRLDPSTLPRRRARQGRTETAALPTAARRRPARVLRPPRQAAPPARPGPGRPSCSPRSRNSKRSPPRPADTSRRPATTTQQTLRPPAAITAAANGPSRPRRFRESHEHRPHQHAHTPPPPSTPPARHLHALTARSGLRARPMVAPRGLTFTAATCGAPRSSEASIAKVGLRSVS